MDSHRTIAQVISPYTQIGNVDSHFYSQVSMLRTMVELFLGIQLLSQFAAALPMIYSFADKPNFTPYQAVSPAQSLNAQTSLNTQSVMNPVDLVSSPDQVDQQKLNEEISKAIKGRNAPMPAPQHHVFPGPRD